MTKKLLSLKQILTSHSEKRTIADILKDLIQKPNILKIKLEPIHKLSRYNTTIAAVYQDGVCFRPFEHTSNHSYLHRNNKTILYKIVSELSESF